jgi:hypothetical protein
MDGGTVGAVGQTGAGWEGREEMINTVLTTVDKGVGLWVEDLARRKKKR